MVSLSSIEKESIATSGDFFKDCLLARKVRNQIRKNFEKKKVSQAPSVNFGQNWLFCKIHVLWNIFRLSMARVLKKYIRSRSYLMVIFFKENSRSYGKFTERLFLLQFFYAKFFEPVIFRFPVSGC